MTRREKRANAAAQVHKDRAVAGQTRANAIDPADPWAMPREVDPIDAAMGAGRTGDLMPAYKDIPEEFRRYSGNNWVELQREWFFRGLPKNALGDPKPGIDAAKALAHLSAIQRSFEPGHEHKVAGVAYLMSRWFQGA